MPRKSSDYRAAVWRVLEDGQWHSILRHEDGRRIVNRVCDGKSEYRYTCECGALPADEVIITLESSCEQCRPVLRELGVEVEDPPLEELQRRVSEQLDMPW